MSEHDEHTLIRIVNDDVVKAYDDLKENDSGRKRRVYVRAVVAAIEAMTYLLKQAALERMATDPQRFSTGEIAMLREEVYYVDRKGAASTGLKIVPVPDNFRFA